MATYKTTFSSGDKFTSTANQVIDFRLDSNNNCTVQYLHVQTFDQSCHIKLNGESVSHWIDVNSEFIISDLEIDKFTVVESGITLYYTALSDGVRRDI